jgi:energy-coupling factor transporter ATP-binding protein EcfA2
MMRACTCGWQSATTNPTTPAPPQDAAIGWGSADSGNDPLLTNIDLIVKKGQRILVLGPNGAGKSTLLKMMAGQLAPWAGTRSLGDGVKLGVFAQDLAQVCAHVAIKAVMSGPALGAVCLRCNVVCAATGARVVRCWYAGVAWAWCVHSPGCRVLQLSTSARQWHPPFNTCLHISNPTSPLPHQQPSEQLLTCPLPPTPPPTGAAA